MAEGYLARYADVYEDRVVFTFENDLWIAPTAGGDAVRITSDSGAERNAKFCPDGSMLAFTGNYDGGTDVYVMDVGGGVPKRLTFHPAADEVLEWFPDGKHILFRSRRAYPWRGEEVYKVSIDGGMPERLPVDRAGLTTISPDGKMIAYNRMSRESRTWKRHQGGTAQDIWLGSLDKADYKRVTDWPGSDNYPMWWGDYIYFNSDREYGTLNIYRMKVANGDVEPMTSFKDYDVKYPSIGPGGIVFQYGERLHLLDIDTGNVRAIDVNIPSDRVQTRASYVGVTANTGSFGLSPAGERVLFETRGELINLPVDHGDPINLTHTSGTREKSAAWSPDGRWVAFISDKTGEEELYLVDQKGEQPWRQLTKAGKAWRMQPLWSPDSKWLLFGDKFMRLNLVDAETGEIRVVDQGEYDDGWERWGVRDYVWSSDSKWIAYAKLEGNLNQSIFLYSLDAREIHRVTSEMTQDSSPSFDPEGKYLYFLSERTYNPIMCMVDQNHIFLDMCRPYLVVLKDDEPSPYALKDSSVEVKEDAATADADATEAAETQHADDAKADADAKNAIDTRDIEGRTIAVRNVPAGNYFRLEAVKGGFVYLKKEGHEFLKYQAVSDTTGDRVDLYGYKFDEDNPEDTEPERLISGINNYHLSADGKKLVYRSGGTIGVVDAGKKASVGDGKLDLDRVKLKIEKLDEFMQIYNEAWRVQRDWFYDNKMHGVDWVAVGEKYRRFVPYCGNRADLNYLIGEMIGELNVGHTYIYGGDNHGGGRYVPVGLLGAQFDAPEGADFYRISHIIPGKTWDEGLRSPLADVGCPIKEGDYVIAIDGEEVRTSDNVYRHLENKRGDIVTLTYNTKPTPEGAKDYRIRTLGSESAIGYREWVDRNYAAVDEASGGKVGYVHLPDMMEGGLIEFAKGWYAQYPKQAMIIDARYNGGGFTGDMIIDRIERELWALTQPREGKTVRDPERCFHGHVVVLINEDTGSNGEYFSEAIKIKKLGTLIGVRTWGGAIGIEPHQGLVDGGTTTPPQFAPFGLNRQWLIEGRGVVPDIEVQNLPGDVIRGKDAQLDAGISYLLDRIEKDPMPIPPTPEYPDKSKSPGV